jgi:hypothetical protein
MVEKYHTRKTVEMHPDAPHGPILLRMPHYFTCQRESAVIHIVIGSYILVIVTPVMVKLSGWEGYRGD